MNIMFDIRKNSFGMPLVVLSAICFATKGIFAKLLYAKGIDPVTLLALRFAAALPLFWLAVYFFPSEKAEPRDIVVLVISGLFGIFASALANFYGLLYIDVTIERMIIYASPAMVITLNALITRRRPLNKTLFAVVVIYAGLAMTMKIWGTAFNTNIFAIGLVVFSAIMSAIWFLMTEFYSTRVSVVKISAYTMTAPTFAFIGIWVYQGASVPADQASWWLIAALAIFSTLLPVIGMTIGIKLIGSNKASVGLFVGPVFTAFMAWVLLGETMDALQITGMIIVIAGIYIKSTVKAVGPMKKDLHITPSVAE